MTELNLDKYNIIDFHTHPFKTDETNICSHIPYCHMSMENTVRDLKSMGVKKICGSVVKGFERSKGEPAWDDMKALNDEALFLRDYYKGYYVPGFHVHPFFVKESIAEIERMHKLGVNLIGELVHYMHGWSDYSDKRLWEILEAAEHYKMILSFHADSGADETLANQMDEMVKHFQNLVIVGAHPCDRTTFEHHLKRFDSNPNYMIDVSGGGIFRHGLLRHLIDYCGKEKVLYGSDYPTCNPAMFIGGVALDFLITEEEKEYVFHKNAERILGIKA